MRAGTTNNVIPESALLQGTLRTVSESSRRTAKEAIDRVAKNIAKAHGAWAEVELTEGYGVTVNDGRMVDVTAAAMREMLGQNSFIPMPSAVMGAEDWSYVLNRIPGCMAFLGVAPAGCDHNTAAPCHSNKMMLEESAMAHGIALYAAVAERFLERGFAT
jgi:hippurate hydrolase